MLKISKQLGNLEIDEKMKNIRKLGNLKNVKREVQIIIWKKLQNKKCQKIWTENMQNVKNLTSANQRELWECYLLYTAKKNENQQILKIYNYKNIRKIWKI